MHIYIILLNCDKKWSKAE